MPKVLIAEDDFMLADLLAEVLADSGYEVCGIARTVAEAVALGRRHHPQLAVLDIQLADGGLGPDIAAQLAGLDRPGILYATGNIRLHGLTKSDGDACIAKPYHPSDVVSALRLVEEIVRTGATSSPHPRGFQVLEPSAKRRLAC